MVSGRKYRTSVEYNLQLLTVLHFVSGIVPLQEDFIEVVVNQGQAGNEESELHQQMALVFFICAMVHGMAVVYIYHNSPTPLAEKLMCVGVKGGCVLCVSSIVVVKYRQSSLTSLALKTSMSATSKISKSSVFTQKRVQEVPNPSPNCNYVW